MTKHFKHGILIFALACLAFVAKAQTTIYARIEIENFDELIYGPWNNQWKEAQGELVVRFYEDGACTIPYTLTSALTVYVKQSFEQTLNGTPIGWGTIGIEQFIAPAGYNYYAVGGRYLYQHNYVNESGYSYQSNNNDYYELDDPGDASYVWLPTVYPY